MNMKRTLSLLLVAVLGVAFFAAPNALAQDDDDSNDDMNGPMAYVRAVHLAPDAGDVDVYVNGEATDWTGVSYNDIGDWTALDVGDTDVSLVPAGGMMDDAVVGPQTLTLTENTWTTLLVANDADGNPMLYPVEESFAALNPGTTRVTYVNALDSDTEVNFNRDDVAFVSQLAPVGSGSDVGSTSTLEMDSGTYHFTASATQTPDQVYGELEDQEFIETSVYLMIVTGDEDGSELMLDETTRAEYQLLTGELEEPGTIVEAASAHDRLATFADAIETANLTEMLSGEGPYTVFVPLDSVLQQVMTEYEGDAEGFEAYLRDRIVEGDLKSQHVFNSDSLTAVSGTTLDVTGEGDSVYVNGAEILAVNIPATNGTIHIIGQTPQ